MAKKVNKALSKKLYPSEELADVLGSSAAITRGQVMKKVWAYIKENDLQDEDDKRTIIPDDVLGEVIGHKPINMFEMTKKLSKHLSE